MKVFYDPDPKYMWEKNWVRVGELTGEGVELARLFPVCLLIHPIKLLVY